MLRLKVYLLLLVYGTVWQTDAELMLTFTSYCTYAHCLPEWVVLPTAHWLALASLPPLLMCLVSIRHGNSQVCKVVKRLANAANLLAHLPINSATELVLEKKWSSTASIQLAIFTLTLSLSLLAPSSLLFYSFRSQPLLCGFLWLRFSPSTWEMCAFVVARWASFSLLLVWRQLFSPSPVRAVCNERKLLKAIMLCFTLF